MLKNSFIILLLILNITLVSCALMAPKRDFTVNLWEMETKPCIIRLDDDDNEIRKCPSDNDYPEDIIGITLEDYNKERNYQSLLIKECKKWK